MDMSNAPMLNEIMQKAQEMQFKMQQAQQKITMITAQGEAGGGLAKVTLDGQHEMKNLVIDPSLLKEPLAVVEDVIIAAHKDAKRKIEELVKKEVADIAKDMGLPEQ